MPSGIYERTEKHREICRKNARKLGKLPRTDKQLEVLSRGREFAKTDKQRQRSRERCYKLNKLPKTQKQIQSCRNLGLNNKGKCNPHGATVFGDDIIEHHNDLSHGALRPHDVTYMRLAEHSRLHANIRVENGTHHLLVNNKPDWKRGK